MSLRRCHPMGQVADRNSNHSGLLVCIEASMIATGTAIAYWWVTIPPTTNLGAATDECDAHRVDFGFSFIPSSVNWRVPIALQSLFAFGLLYGIHYMPECESDRFLSSDSSLIYVLQLLDGSSPRESSQRDSVSLPPSSPHHSTTPGSLPRPGSFSSLSREHLRSGRGISSLVDPLSTSVVSGSV